MNNAFTDRMARTFAERLTAEAKPADRIAAAYRLAFGRPPTDAETARAEKVTKEAGLKAVCWALLNASEFVYLK